MTKLKTILYIGLIILVHQKNYAQNDTIMIDFGSSSSISEEPWNNISSTDGAGQIELLMNSQHQYTAVGIEVYDRFNGINSTGTTSPNSILGLPSTATQDNYYGSVVEFAGTTQPTAGILFSGLNPEKEYTFEIFASRVDVTDNRETKFKYAGLTKDSVYINPSNNTSAITTFTETPKADGTIDIMITPGENNTNDPYRFYYLGAIKIIYESEDPLAPSLTLESPNGGEVWFAGTNQDILWSSMNLEEDIIVSYSVDDGTSWTDIETVDFSNESLNWLIPENYSDQSKIKITSGSASDLSDGVFSIANPSDPHIILSSPNGGEHLIVGSTKLITWSSINLTENIEIDFSFDSGTSWTNIATVSSEETNYYWTVPEVESSECLIKVSSDSNSDISFETFSILEGVCNNTIVIIGSSTAYGSGASPIDSSWVNRYRDALVEIDGRFEVINLALGGYTTYQLLPTGTAIPNGISENIDAERNITKAMSYSPYAVIVNLPSNDATKYYGVEDQLYNFDLIVNHANSLGVRVWVTTTQPRNFTDPVQIEIQKAMADTIPKVYGENAIDFWSVLADENGYVLSEYNSGDGIHVNNAGHRVLFEQVLESQIDTLACFVTSTSFLEDNNEILLYPNPAYNTVCLDTKAEINSVTVYNLAGQEVMSVFNFDKGDNTLNVSELSEGIYIVSILDVKKRKYSLKLFKN